MAPAIHGGDLLSDHGGVAPQNFDCGGDRPRRPREVGAYGCNFASQCMEVTKVSQAYPNIPRFPSARPHWCIAYPGFMNEVQGPGFSIGKMLIANANQFLSRVSTLTRDIDIAILSVRP